ncbi:carboxymuconolactone decarboxylase family protein [Mycobacterium sp. Aquia_213]|uniref:carboxymuconolactone decarboxylase family protein n=1 Tax=Mycobacterium sp. Aquia_213 TaxID=2991728 RepID=UPI00226E3115|nr:carboxymuconolactone decarboxylase family protein [Mycobacterium sp. Aquia_213]WAC91838.1 carboxymuconolactone decarboxylase family protein [Mycobacterium sp. Aquia_213]
MSSNTLDCEGHVQGVDPLPEHILGLSAKDRSILNIAGAAALLRTDDLRIEIDKALANGVTADEVRDIIEQVALHADLSLAECVCIAEQCLADPGH